MNTKILMASTLVLSTLFGCGPDKTEEANQETKPATTPDVQQVSNKPENAQVVTSRSTDDPAIAVFDYENVTFKLHGFFEFDPTSDPLYKPVPNKKYLMLDLSCENNSSETIDPAVLMLTSKIFDDKGKKYSVAGDLNAPLYFQTNPQYSKALNDQFFQQPFKPGKKVRGYFYGIVMDKDAKPVKWTMFQGGKEVATPIQ